jgi:hypothetical protein
MLLHADAAREDADTRGFLRGKDSFSIDIVPVLPRLPP